MTEDELAIECVRLAIPLASPSTDDRVEAIAKISKRLYAHIKSLSEEALIDDADKPKRGRPPKPRE